MMGVTRKIRQLRKEWPCILHGHDWKPVQVKDDGMWLLCLNCSAWRFS